ncbi:hypothetical protein F5Y00DRAFT_138364 [Daldinia vernicosa]|uniref:uncharacterized protein n=1 Tax=Daldinia vernicosa TaxID=114800 RepID=UPI00200810C6|nr:uncharacterized protein F5Y00DRAFT_138364 [Daldinia vernicosa]KAI0846832.1 hypothetical protein F5Y00DRAFT_138364 [Daldinia vernicosa]
MQTYTSVIFRTGLGFVIHDAFAFLLTINTSGPSTTTAGQVGRRSLTVRSITYFKAMVFVELLCGTFLDGTVLVNATRSITYRLPLRSPPKSLVVRCEVEYSQEPPVLLRIQSSHWLPANINPPTEWPARPTLYSVWSSSPYALRRKLERAN